MDCRIKAAQKQQRFQKQIGVFIAAATAMCLHGDQTLHLPHPVAVKAPPPIDIASLKEGECKVGATQSGIASWYPPTGDLTANLETFDSQQMTAAHKTLPFGTKVKMTNKDNKLSVALRINDRGPYVQGRIIDLSEAAAKKVGFNEIVPSEIKIVSCPIPTKKQAFTP